MRTFKQHIKEGVDGVGVETSNSVEDGKMGAHNIQDEAVLKQVNAFVGAIAEREYILPDQAVSELREKLGRVGLSFGNISLEGDKGTVTAEVKQFGGRYGKDVDSKPEDVINDDGISHKKEGGLKIEFKYEKLSNNTSKVYAKLI